jgi:hypothetical protein
MTSLYSISERDTVHAKEYTECQAFSPVVRICLSPSPHPQASVASPFGSGGGGEVHSLAGEAAGRGEPIWTQGQTIWYL